jgi:hypothetical protein
MPAVATPMSQAARLDIMEEILLEDRFAAALAAAPAISCAVPMPPTMPAVKISANGLPMPFRLESNAPIFHRHGKKRPASAGPVTDLLATVLAEPDNHQARYDLALALHASGKIEAAVEELLELFRRDREWNDGAAKTQLFKIFDALKPQVPIVLNGRRRLSSMIFA